MDNGRHNAIFSNLTPDDDLNQENWQKSLEISAPIDMPSPEQIAGMGVAETAQMPSEKTPLADVPTNLKDQDAPTSAPTPNHFDTHSSPALGQITAISSPTITDTLPGYHPENIRTAGDHLEKSALAEINAATDKLNQTGNLSDFYDEIRNMTEVNLNNSFNRKLYHDDNGKEEG